MIIILFAVILCLQPDNIKAQLNLKIGYNLNYSSFQAHNQILQEFNKANPWLTKGFDDLKIFNGLQMGARLRGEFVGIDFTWERSSASRNAVGIDPSGLNFESEFDYKLNRFSLGLETYNQFFGVGANVYWERLGISSPIASIESEEEVFIDNRFGNRIYLILSTSGSDRLSLSLQPYIAIPWSHYNLGPLASNLNISTKDGWIQENIHFGFSVVFYNGRQP